MRDARRLKAVGKCVPQKVESAKAEFKVYSWCTTDGQELCPNGQGLRQTVNLPNRYSRRAEGL